MCKLWGHGNAKTSIESMHELGYTGFTEGALARRIFISYQHADQLKAKGFNLLRWNKNVDLEFVGRHLLDPVNSENEGYITEKVKEQLNGTSVTVVLLGHKTADSDWVKREVEWSVEKNNGVVAVKLSSAT